MSEASERALMFHSGGACLVGVLHPGTGARPRTGVLIIVGGPQYRIGSHRQFVLMARALAKQGHDVLRFDYRGMGDSEGTYGGFERCDDDVRAAIDVFLRECPHLRGVHLFGLCDGASAALMYAPKDTRVSGLILANPWVRSETTQAATYLRHYYWKRAFQASFWLKLFKGGLEIREAISGLSANVRQARSTSAACPGDSRSFVIRMRDALGAFSGRTLLLLSDDDLTALEFMDILEKDRDWISAAKKARVVRRAVRGGDHTFSRRVALDAATRDCAKWLAGVMT